MSIRNWGRIFARVMLIFSGMLIAGCSIYPTIAGLQQDRDTGNFTYSADISAYIADKAKCEFRDSFVKIGTTLISDPDYNNKNYAVEKLLEIPGYIRFMPKWDIDPLAQVRASIILSSQYQMDFRLDVTETNDNSVGLGLHPTSPPKVISLGISDSEMNLSRQNIRSFSFLPARIEKLQNVRCFNDAEKVNGTLIDHDKIRNHPKSHSENYVYPITGSIGLQKIASFFSKFLTGEVSEIDKKSIARKSLAFAYERTINKNHEGAKFDLSDQIIDKNVHEMEKFASELREGKRTQKYHDPEKCYGDVLADASDLYNLFLYNKLAETGGPVPSATPGVNGAVKDEVEFTTEFKGGIKPSITFASATGNLALNSANIGFKNTRKDKHKITISVTPATKYAIPNKKPTHFSVEDTPIGESGDSTIYIYAKPKKANSKPIDAAKEPENCSISNSSKPRITLFNLTDQTGFVAQRSEDPAAAERLINSAAPDVFVEKLRPLLKEQNPE